MTLSVIARTLTATIGPVKDLKTIVLFSCHTTNLGALLEKSLSPFYR